jgi:hypothetical protein
MKCSFCTYDHQPANPILLKAHAETCILEGNTGGIIPVVVWRDGSFILVREAGEEEQTYDFGIVDSRPPEEEVIASETVYEEPLEEDTHIGVVGMNAPLIPPQPVLGSN